MRRNGCSHEDYKYFLCEFLSLLTITSISAASGTIWYANNTIKFTWLLAIIFQETVLTEQEQGTVSRSRFMSEWAQMQQLVHGWGQHIYQ